MTGLLAVPLTLAELNNLVSRLHRHHRPVTGHKFSIGAAVGGHIVGGVCVGRPVARLTDQRFVAEVTRLVTDGTPNACSFLYGAAARACMAMGYRSIQTFILDSETGASLRASGWKIERLTEGGVWDRPSRSRADNHPKCGKAKYVRTLNNGGESVEEATPLPLFPNGGRAPG